MSEEAVNLQPRRSGRECKTAVTVYGEAAAEKKSDDAEKKGGRMTEEALESEAEKKERRTISPETVVLAKEKAPEGALVAVAEQPRRSGRECKTAVTVCDEAAAKKKPDEDEKRVGKTNEEGLVAVSGDRSFRVSVVLASDKVTGVTFSKRDCRWETKVYHQMLSLHCGCFKLKSDAIAAKAVAEDTINVYIRRTFNVEKSATLTTEQRTTLSNWWKEEKKSERSLMRKDGLPQGIYLVANNKFSVTISEDGYRMQLGIYTHLDEAKAVIAAVAAEIDGFRSVVGRTMKVQDIFDVTVTFDARIRLLLPDLAALKMTNPRMIVSESHKLYDIIGAINKYHSLLLNGHDSPLARNKHHLVSLIDFGFCFLHDKGISGKKRKLLSVSRGCAAKRNRVLNEESDGYSAIGQTSRAADQELVDSWEATRLGETSEDRGWRLDNPPDNVCAALMRLDASDGGGSGGFADFGGDDPNMDVELDSDEYSSPKPLPSLSPMPGDESMLLEMQMNHPFQAPSPSQAPSPIHIQDIVAI